MLTGYALAIALSVTAVPPTEEVEDHSQPYHETQPELRRYERHPDDLDRRLSWESYVRELRDLWAEYREAGSTARAWREYKEAAAEAKRRYVYGDIYLMPIIDDMYFEP
jgi:hypothetical protein